MPLDAFPAHRLFAIARMGLPPPLRWISVLQGKALAILLFGLGLAPATVSAQLWRVDPSYSPQLAYLESDVHPDSGISAWTQQSDGKFIFSGNFDSVNGTSFPSQGVNVVRLNTDGSIDDSFPNLNGIAGGIGPLFQEPSGQLLDSVFSGCQLINPDGSLQAGFPLTSTMLFGVAVDSTGRIYGTTSTQILTRYNPDGTLDGTFSCSLKPPGAGFGQVLPLADGKAYLVLPIATGFNITVQRLNSDGSLDPSFSELISPNEEVTQVAGYCVFSDDSLLVVTKFTSIFGQIYFTCTHLNPAGTADYTYYFATSGNDSSTFAGVAYDLLLRIGGNLAYFNVNSGTVSVTRNGQATVVEGAFTFPFYPLPTRLLRTSPGVSPSIPAAPSFFTQPQAYTGLRFSVTLSAVPLGLEPLTYQWFKDNVAIPNANGLSFQLVGNFFEQGVYYLTATNSQGSASTVPVTVVFTDPPQIFVQPVGGSADVGSGPEFSVEANGGGTLTYQWAKDGVPINGATSNFLSLSNVQLGDAGNYTVTVSNAYGSVISMAAALTVSATPTLAPTLAPTPSPTLSPTPTSAPRPTPTATVAPRPSPTPSPTASPVPTPSPTRGVTPTPIQTVTPTPSPTATASPVTVLTPTPVATPPPSVTPPPTPVPTPSPITTPTPSSVTVPIALPVSQSVLPGQSAIFSVSSGASASNYQWLFNGLPIAGANGPSYTVPSAAAADSGSYSVTLTESSGLVTSTGALLAVQGTNSPVVMAQPQSQTIAQGSTVIFSVEDGQAISSAGASSGSMAPRLSSVRVQGASAGNSHQWFLNGSPVAGATNSSLIVGAATTRDAGSYSCLITNPSGSTLTAGANLVVSATDNPGHLINISTRGMVQTGGGIMIAGLVTSGGTGGTEPLLIRASGPALASFGVVGTLADPQITLLNGQTLVGANAGWNGSLAIASQATAVGAFTWGTTATADSAISTSLLPGSYTAQVSSVNGGTGIALVEVYDATTGPGSSGSSPHLVNISTRGFVGTGGNVLIAGFVIGGTTSRTVLIRASGPALAKFGVTNTLADPEVNLLSGQTSLAFDAGWNGDPQIAAEAAAVGAFSWGTAATPDSAVLITLPPGAYTAQVQGVAGDTGIGLIEVYAVP